jgi:hypothetical protein
MICCIFYNQKKPNRPANARCIVHIAFQVMIPFMNAPRRSCYNQPKIGPWNLHFEARRQLIPLRIFPFFPLIKFRFFKRFTRLQLTENHHGRLCNPRKTPLNSIIYRRVSQSPSHWYPRMLSFGPCFRIFLQRLKTPRISRLKTSFFQTSDFILSAPSLKYCIADY